MPYAVMKAVPYAVMKAVPYAVMKAVPYAVMKAVSTSVMDHMTAGRTVHGPAITGFGSAELTSRRGTLFARSTIVSSRRPAEYLSNSFLDRFTSIAVVAAHPDDEVIGAGALLQRFEGPRYIIHITDGAPDDMRDAYAAGCLTRERYAQLRREEFFTALAPAGLSRSACVALGVADQHASLQMADLSRQLARRLDELRPDLVVTHPYEGGHPDHDAAAFAVRAAVRLIERAGARAPATFEMTSYHAGPNGIETGRFLPGGAPAITIELSPDESSRKSAMLACFESQAAVLANFGDLSHELLRPAPVYDFSRAPHAGRLFYECFEWGMDGTRWRSLAADAIAILGLESPSCV